MSSSWLAQRRRRQRKYTTDALEWMTNTSTTATTTAESTSRRLAQLHPHHIQPANSQAHVSPQATTTSAWATYAETAPSILLRSPQNLQQHINSTPPTTRQLQAQFLAAAIPMIGFGFMDNLVMIQAGNYIDTTLGVQLGLATMTAAAEGQVVSDVSGVIFGNTMEAFFAKWFPIQNNSHNSLTLAQRRLPLVRRVKLAGAVLGVTLGCALGALALLFVDLETKEQHAQWRQLHDILQDLQEWTAMASQQQSQESNTSTTTTTQFTLYVLMTKDDDSHLLLEQPNNNNTNSNMIQPLHLDDEHTSHHHQHHHAWLRKCAQSQSTLTREYELPTTTRSNHHSTTTTAVTHYVPIRAGKDVVGVLEYTIQYHYDHDKNDLSDSEDDTTNAILSKERAELMASHIGILLNRME